MLFYKLLNLEEVTVISILKSKTVLAELVLLEHNENDMDWESYRDIVMDELNVKAFHVELDETKYTSYQLKLNFKTAGPKFGKM